MTWSNRAIAACEAELDCIEQQRVDVYLSLSDRVHRTYADLPAAVHADLETLAMRQDRAYDLRDKVRARRIAK